MSEMALELITRAKRDKVQKLDLGNCGIVGSVPMEVASLEGLKELSLSNRTWDWNKSKWIHSKNQGTPNNINEIVAIPQTIESLNLSELDIHEIECVRRAKGITALLLHNTNVVDISPISELKKLKELKVSRTRIVDIEALVELKNLTELAVHRTQITSLEALRNLKKLRKLWIYSTKIRDLSPLSELKNLEAIWASDTLVNSLIPLAGLKNLRTVSIFDTFVQDLSPLKGIISSGVEVNDSRFTNGITIAQCPLTNPPIEIARHGRGAVLEYWNRLELEGEYLKFETLNWHCKLMIVGNARVGKTTLVDLLLGKNRSTSPDRTEILDRVQWQTKFTVEVGDEYSHKEGIKGSPIVQIFDFGGQEYYHDTHHLFFGSDTAYLVLWKPAVVEYEDLGGSSANEGKSNATPVEGAFPLPYWLDAIGHFCKIPPADAFHDWDESELAVDDEEVEELGYSREHVVHHTRYHGQRQDAYRRIPTVVLQTHADKVTDEFLNQYQLNLDFPWIIDFEKISLTSNDNIGTAILNEKLRRLLSKIPILGRQISTTYAWVREALETLQEMKVLSREEFILWANEVIEKRIATKTIQSRELFFGERDIHYLIHYLDSTGSLRHFEGDALEDRVFLRPDLLKHEILGLLRKLKPMGGEFTVNDAARILGSKFQGNVETLLALLEEFKMAFRIGYSENRRWVAPLYLPTEPPAGVSMLLEIFDRPVRRIVYPNFIHKSVVLELFQAYSKDILIQPTASLQSDQYVVWRDGMVIKMKETGEYVLIKYFVGEVSYREQAHIDIFAFKTPLGSHPADAVLKRLQKINHYWTTVQEVTSDGKVFVPLEKVESASKERRPSFSHDGVVYNVEDYAAFVTIPWKRIFISYAPEDEAFCQALEKHMDPMRKKEKIALWNKAKLVPGMERDAEIQRELRRADIVVMLLSADFFYDRDIWNVEMKETLERAGLGECTIAWVEVRHCDWESTSLAGLVSLHGNAEKKNVVGMPDNDEAWVTVVKSLKELIARKGGGK